MPESQFIGREDELRKLSDLVQSGIKHQGGTLFIEGTKGMGSSALVREFEDRVHKNPQLEDVIFISVECDRESPESGYQPFIDILESFDNPKLKRRELGKKAIKIISDYAGDWLDFLPFGTPIKAAVKMAAKATDIALTSENNTPDRGIRLTRQYVKAILEIASGCKLLILIIEYAQHIDTSSCQLLKRLSRAALEHNLILILNYNPEELNERSHLNNFLPEMKRKGIAEVITLTGWDVEEIRKYLHSMFGEFLIPNLAEWLKDECNGEPSFITNYISLLVTKKIIENTHGKYELKGQIKQKAGELVVEGELKDVLPPEYIEDLIRERFEGLQKEEQQILQAGAIQGRRFMTYVLRRLLSKQNDEIIEYLMQIEEERQLISRCKDEESLGLKSDVYSFVLSLMQQSIYNRLPDAHRSEKHSKIARILEEFLTDVRDKYPTLTLLQKLMIQIARHYELGGESFSAARCYLQSAQSTFNYGALKETSELCQRALDNIHHLDKLPLRAKDVTESDSLRLEAIQLKLTASEMWWHGKPEYDQELSSEEEVLVHEAEAAALRTGNMSMAARIKYLKGKIYITTNNLDGSIESLKEALQIAKDTQDSLAEFFIMAELGYRIIGSTSTDGSKTLDSGLRLQYEAHDIFHSRLKSQIDPAIATDLDRHLYQLKARIGVGEFDRGNYSEAMRWLLESINGFKNQKRIEELAWSLNFIGQVYTAVGLFEEADNVLREAIELHKDEEDPIAIRGYNLALLGRLYMDWGQVEKAEKYLMEGWAETQRVWMVAVVPLIRNYYTELLIQPHYHGQDLSRAEDYLKTTISEAERSKFHRNKIIALWLWGNLDLIRRDIRSALNHSTEAVRYLEEMGVMPPICMERVFFDHYRILNESPDHQREARNYLDRAYSILQYKANSLKNEEHKNKFLKRAPTSSLILSALHA
jgi:tetratricopeptide (TPR) repeat protein